MMTKAQMFITFIVILAATVSTRFLPYLIFPQGKKTPAFVSFLGKYLAPAVFGLLIVYCFRNTDLLTPFSRGGGHGIPELIAAAVVIGTFLWKRSMVLSMAAGTILYMLMMQLIF